MNDAHRNKLRKNQVRFIKGLDLGDGLISYLVEKDILTEEMKERIEVHPVGHRSRTSELLSLLPKRGPKAFGIFIEALIETKQVDLAEDLDEDLTANLLKHMVTEETTHSQETNEPGVRPVDTNIAEKLLNQKDDVYDMSNNPRGRAVIINNKYFYDEELHRHGTDHDKEKLQELFRKLYFDTITHDNLTAEQIRETLKEESRKQESSANAFVLCILSHGENDHILGTDEEMISIDDITAMFDGKSCPTLINKPKIFIFQACRGKAKTSGVTLEQTDLDETDFEDKMKQMNIRDSTDAEPIPKRHEKADMIKAFATVPDYVSWRHKLEGSWFINDLVDTFAECACNDDILSLLGEVTKRVAARKTSKGEYIGLTQMHVQLLKKLYFFPGYSKPSQNHTHKRSDSIQATD